ncbi:hypothetical protein [Nocardiopsis sp. CNT312]|uniref:hypothetical protein n=1 Tax=Nocardiopsis sp. CNT312 TaxID=1137268 RepID=UPI0004BA0079|nr:hypothetical protein [Nocardiopsis sp. CNT312]
MERVALDPASWSRLVVSAAGLSRTVQASLTTLGLLMSPSGSVRNALAHLVGLTDRSRSTISEHLGTAQAQGWLTCLERGGQRADGPRPSVYQATVPAQVWQRREEFLAPFACEEPDQDALPVFPAGSVIPAQDHRGPSSEFSAQKINPSIPQGEAPAAPSKQQVALAPGTDPVIAAVIEELAALADHVVSPAWAARCVSQIMRHRRVRHPIAYVVKTLQNAAGDGTLTERFLPPQAAGRRSGQYPAQEPAPVADRAPEQESTAASGTGAGEAPWDRSSFPTANGWGHEPETPAAPVAEPDRPAAQPDAVGSPPEPQEPPQEIYRPGGRVLSGLGETGAKELLRLRRQLAERQHPGHQQSRSQAERAEPLVGSLAPAA